MRWISNWVYIYLYFQAMSILLQILTHYRPEPGGPCTCIKGTMSHLQVKKMKRLNSNGMWKTIIYRTSLKTKGFDNFFCGKIMTISHQINISDCNHLSNSLIFRPLYWMVVRFVLHKDSIIYIWPLQVVGYWCRQMLMHLLQLILCTCYYQRKNMSVSHLTVSDREV